MSDAVKFAQAGKASSGQTPTVTICAGCKSPIESMHDVVIDLDERPARQWHGLCWRIAGPYATVRIPCMKSHKHDRECE